MLVYSHPSWQLCPVGRRPGASSPSWGFPVLQARAGGSGDFPCAALLLTSISEIVGMRRACAGAVWWSSSEALICVCMVPPAHFVVMRGSCTENGPVEIPIGLGAGRTEGEGTERRCSSLAFCSWLTMRPGNRMVIPGCLLHRPEETR